MTTTTFVEAEAAEAAEASEASPPPAPPRLSPRAGRAKAL